MSLRHVISSILTSSCTVGLPTQWIDAYGNIFDTITTIERVGFQPFCMPIFTAALKYHLVDSCQLNQWPCFSFAISPSAVCSNYDWTVCMCSSNTTTHINCLWNVCPLFLSLSLSLSFFLSHTHTYTHSCHNVWFWMGTLDLFLFKLD